MTRVYHQLAIASLNETKCNIINKDNDDEIVYNGNIYLQVWRGYCCLQ